MKNIEKIDDFDLIFINEPLSEKESKEFSDFLKARKLNQRKRQNRFTQTSKPRNHANDNSGKLV